MNGIDTLEDLERRAPNEGCEDHGDDYPSCVDGEFECRSGGVVDAGGWEPEFARLLRCLG